MTTLDNLMQHLERVWQKPSAEWQDDLPHLIVHTLRNHVTIVWSGSDLLCDIFAAHPSELIWAQTCKTATRQWDQAFEIAESDCTHTLNNPVEICQCLLQKLGPIIANSATLIEQAPRNELPNQYEAKVLNIVKQGLSRLAKISDDLEQKDLTWLKDFIDREGTSSARSTKR